MSPEVSQQATCECGANLRWMSTSPGSYGAGVRHFACPKCDRNLEAIGFVRNLMVLENGAWVPAESHGDAIAG